MESALVAKVDSLYGAVPHGDLYNASSTPAASIGAAHALTYGEISSPLKLFSALELCSTDCFYDLGSGRGQAVFAACMMDVRPRKAHGVELVESRHNLAARAASVLNVQSPACAAIASFSCGDATAVDLRDATKVFINNAVFSGEISSRFAAALDPTLAPQLQRVATINELPESACTGACLRLAAMTTISGTWATEGTTLFVYMRSGGGENGAAPPVVVDRNAIDGMLSARRSAVERLEREQRVTDAEGERIRMRNALIAAAAGR